MSSVTKSRSVRTVRPVARPGRTVARDEGPRFSVEEIAERVRIARELTDIISALPLEEPLRVEWQPAAYSLGDPGDPEVGRTYKISLDLPAEWSWHTFTVDTFEEGCSDMAEIMDEMAGRLDMLAAEMRKTAERYRRNAAITRKDE